MCKGKGFVMTKDDAACNEAKAAVAAMPAPAGEETKAAPPSGT
jgi:hypothetical protein